MHTGTSRLHNFTMLLFKKQNLRHLKPSEETMQAALNKPHIVSKTDCLSLSVSLSLSLFHPYLFTKENLLTRVLNKVIRSTQVLPEPHLTGNVEGQNKNNNNKQTKKKERAKVFSIHFQTCSHSNNGFTFVALSM